MTDTVVSMPSITAANAAAMAAAFFASIQVGEKEGFTEKEGVMQSFIVAARKIRDEEKAKVTKTRPRLELPTLIEQSLGKALGDLSAVKFPLIDNVTVKVGDLFRIANSEDHMLHKAAAAFIETNGLELRLEEAGSRGKGKQVLRRVKGWTPPAVEPETQPEANASTGEGENTQVEASANAETPAEVTPAPEAGKGGKKNAA